MLNDDIRRGEAIGLLLHYVKKRYCFHRAQVCISMNKKVEQRLWLSFRTIFRLAMALLSAQRKILFGI